MLIRLLFTALVLVASVGRGQAPAAASAGPRSHGWFVLEVQRSGEPAPYLFHVPPRSLAPDGSRGAMDGALRSVMTFRGRPEALAAHDDEVFMAFSPESENASGRREVLSLRALPASMSGQWFYEPMGRLVPHASLPGRGRLIGMAWCRAGLAALLHGPSAAGRSPEWRLLVLAEGAWRDVPLPEGDLALPGDAEGTHLLASDGLLAVARVEDGRVRVWRADVRVAVDRSDLKTDQFDPNAPLSKPSVSVSASWSARAPVSLPPGGRGVVTALAADDAVLLLVREAGGPCQILACAPAGVRVLAVVEGLPAEARSIAAMVLHDTSRLVLAWPAPADVSGATPRVLELSTSTGRVLYEGPGRLEGPMSATEFRILAIGLFLVMGLILLFLLRKDPDDGVVRIPEGHALLAPLPRAAATAIDVLLAGLVASWLVDEPLESVFTIAALASEGGRGWGLLATIAVGLTGSVVLEWLFGATPGKAVFRSRVCPLGDRMRRPSLRAALVRNLCKWLVPPLALALVWDPNLRHRGDVLAGVAVISARPVVPPQMPGKPS